MTTSVPDNSQSMFERHVSRVLATGIPWQCPCILFWRKVDHSAHGPIPVPEAQLSLTTLDTELVCRYTLVIEQPVSHSQCFDCMHSILGVSSTPTA